jgi:hypothetical protein
MLYYIWHDYDRMNENLLNFIGKPFFFLLPIAGLPFWFVRKRRERKTIMFITMILQTVKYYTLKSHTYKLDAEVVIIVGDDAPCPRYGIEALASVHPVHSHGV